VSVDVLKLIQYIELIPLINQKYQYPISRWNWNNH